MKDAKGHGSDARGAHSDGITNIDKNLRGPGKHVGYAAGDVWHIQKSNGPNSNWYSAVGQQSGASLSAQGLGAMSQKLTNYDKPIMSVAESAAHAAGPAASVAAQHGIDTSHLSNGLGRGLNVDWSKAPNPYSSGFASAKRADRNSRAQSYVESRASRASNFSLGKL